MYIYIYTLFLYIYIYDVCACKGPNHLGAVAPRLDAGVPEEVRMNHGMVNSEKVETTLILMDNNWLIMVKNVNNWLITG